MINPETYENIDQIPDYMWMDSNFCESDSYGHTRMDYNGSSFCYCAQCGNLIDDIGDPCGCRDDDDGEIDL